MTIFRQFAGYGAASACALALDVTTLWVLVEYFGCNYLAAATASFVAGASVAYVLSIKFAFRHHRLANRGAEFVSFVALGTVGLAINAGVMAFAVRFLGSHYLIAKCVAAGMTFMCNFALRRQLLFVRPTSSEESLCPRP